MRSEYKKRIEKGQKEANMLNRKKIFMILTLLWTMVGLSFCVKENPRSSLLAKRGEIRSYEGAPPIIPHKITASGKDYCLTCHEKGIVFNKDVEIWGKKELRAKITPHPQWQNCLQCHVIHEDIRVFKENTFTEVSLAHPPKPQVDPENPSEPPKMPHQLQNRENCTICHIKKTANAEIIPAHGEQEYCEACHQPAEAFMVYQE